MYHFSKKARLRIEKHTKTRKDGSTVRQIVTSVPLDIDFIRGSELDPFAEYDLGYTTVVKGRAFTITCVKREVE